jgi:hypothetical protein
MRWKERFLVPDHRVRDINGASFAGACQRSKVCCAELTCGCSTGFYYVCVELGDETAADARTTRSGSVGDMSSEPDSPIAHSRTETADEDYEMEQAPETVPLKGGRMVGYYFHENSEP